MHLDRTMGAISNEELSPVKFLNLKISSRAKSNIPKILPRKIHGRCRNYGMLKNVRIIGTLPHRQRLQSA
ncbi:MAG: hypothetical protein QXQ41_03070 [Candidatus Bathyarchaeia archaeon]